MPQRRSDGEEIAVMKNCPHCNIKVGGDRDTCPLCQSTLLGEGEEPYWPKPEHLKHVSVAVKIINFILLSLAVIIVAYDFLILNGPHKHVSLVLLTWGIVIYALVIHFVRRRANVPRILFQSMLIASIVLIVDGMYLGFMGLILYWIMPILCSITLVLNFVFSFIDKGFTEDSLVYMLLNIVVGVVPYIVIYFHRAANPPLTWTITLIISAITFIGLVVFKGKKVFAEMQRRLHM
ncbi:MAG: hypothetical protein K6E13_07740 [Lachnospiraceae bacterium]|nr:hypothetical protein [Lachnospiraceae bacterium]